MKRGIGWLVLALALTGCQSMSTTDKGVLTGGGLGALAGGVIGNQSGNTAAGAAIGGILGGIAGGVTGNAIEQTEARNEARIAAATAPLPQGPLDMYGVAELARNHVDDNLIIQQIRTTGSRYNLTTQDIIWLRSQGVSNAVISVMQSTATMHPRRVCGPPPATVYVIEQPPPPPVIGFGFGYTHHHRRCR